MDKASKKTHLSDFIPETVRLLELITQELQNDQRTQFTIIVGLSGGPDSVFLLRLLDGLVKQKIQHSGHESSITLIAAHLNHGWRQSAQQDEAFCKNLCAELNIPLEIGYGQDFPINTPGSGSKEDDGRKKRKLFFDYCKKKYAAQIIALAHHRDDQLETFFIRLARGSSLEGLGCMRPWSPPYFRPLLTIPKKIILDLCTQENFAFCIDESNDSETFLRNRIRKNLLPCFPLIDSRLEINCLRTITQLQQDQDLLQELTEQHFMTIFSQKEEHDKTSFVGNKKNFISQSSRMQQRIILLWLIKQKVPFSCSQGLINEIIRFLYTPHGGTHRLHESWVIIKKQQLFWLIH